MSILAEQLRNDLAAEYGQRAELLSLHQANPGTDGSNEISGGGYARQSLVWGAPSGGKITAVTTFDLPVTTITHVGVWDAAGTTFLDSYVLPSPIDVPLAGQRNVNVVYTQT